MNYIPLIKENIESQIQTRLDEKKPFQSSVFSFFARKKNFKKPIDKILDYEKMDDIGLNIDAIDLIPPLKIKDLVPQIQHKYTLTPAPILIVSVEDILTDYKKEITSLYNEFKTGDVKETSEDAKFIIRFESIRETNKYLYTIINEKIKFDSELPSDGKIFFPYFN